MNRPVPCRLAPHAFGRHISLTGRMLQQRVRLVGPSDGPVAIAKSGFRCHANSAPSATSRLRSSIAAHPPLLRSAHVTTQCHRTGPQLQPSLLVPTRRHRPWISFSAGPSIECAASDALSSVESSSWTSGTGSMFDAESLEIVFDNESHPECTIVTIEGKDQSHLLMRLSSAFTTLGIMVITATIKSDDGRVLDVFYVQMPGGKKVPESDFEAVRQRIYAVTASGSTRSSKPAIFGIVAAAEVERLRPMTVGAADSTDVANLELASAEMAQAAAELVTSEREILVLRKRKGADPTILQTKEAQRSEAAAGLERKMAAMQAMLAARRALAVEPEKVVTPEEAAQRAVAELMKPIPLGTGTAVGAGCGSGFEILLQAFNWESHKYGWYRKLKGQVADIARAGITSVWMPPPSDSVSPQGYLPRDLYNLDSVYGTEGELRDLINTFHENNIKVIADIVINHRCAQSQGPDGKWNKFGGRLAWDASAIASNNPAFGGRGNHKTGDDYAAAPNIDHSQEKIRQDIIQWLKWLRGSVGFDGWRLDFVRGYSGQYTKQYIDETVPAMAFGEYWDSCEYTDGVLNYNQDAHRQRTINWCDSTGGTSAAFDFTTKGILQEAVGRRELWRLSDSKGRPPGVIGVWPSRAITFIDNHDTGSTLNHWPFPSNHLHEGYAYLLTHPGTPTVFWDHFVDTQGNLRSAVLELIAVRKKHGINARSKVVIKKATNDVYAAVIDDKIAMKIGTGDWSPRSAGVQINGRDFKLACSGPNFAVWELQ